MQAIELNSEKENWIIFILLFSFILLAFLKLLKPKNLVGYCIAFFNPGFFKQKESEFISVFSPFKLTLFLFSTIILSLIIYSLFVNHLSNNIGFYFFLKIFTVVFCFLVIKYFTDVFLASVLDIKEEVNYFLQLKYSYLSTICLLIYPVVVVNEFAITTNYFLITILTILILFRFLLILFNNKRLILGKLFYFILYFCTLEIAPLLILYKTTTT